MPLMWCEETEKCITSQSLSSAPGLSWTLLAVTGRAPPPVETVRPLSTHSVQQLGQRHTGLWAEHWPVYTGHVDTCHWQRQQVKKIASQRTRKKFLDSHCERYLKHCPLRSEFYLAAVSWLLTLTHCLGSRHNCHHCAVRVIPALTVRPSDCVHPSRSKFSNVYWRLKIIRVQIYHEFNWRIRNTHTLFKLSLISQSKVKNVDLKWKIQTT